MLQEVRVITTELITHVIYIISHHITQDALGDASSGGSSMNSNAELCAMINRDMGRIGALFRLPTSLSLITSVPEVFVFNGVRKATEIGLAPLNIAFL